MFVLKTHRLMEVHLCLKCIAFSVFKELFFVLSVVKCLKFKESNKIFSSPLCSRAGNEHPLDLL
jgi:hypothetical protein